MYLFCIPHAGGSVIAYNAWKKHLNKTIELIPLELPGHMLRSQEKLVTDYQIIIKDQCSKVLEIVQLTNEPYAIYGHSLGAVLVYYLYHEIVNEGGRPPCHLFVSGRWAPNIIKDFDEYPIDDMAEFKKFIINLEGIDAALINNETMFNYFINIIYSDFILLKQIPVLQEIKKINANLTFLRGLKDDSNPIDDGMEWRKYTNHNYSQYEVEGDHFFPTENLYETVKIINKELEQYLCANEADYQVLD